MNQFSKFAEQRNADQRRERVRNAKTVGQILALPLDEQHEAWRLAFFEAFVPENGPEEPRGFNSEILDEERGVPTGGHEPWETGE